MFREVVGRREDEVFNSGYGAAAEVCMDVLEARAEGLRGRITSGDFLSEPEQLVLATLDQLKSEMDAALRGSALVKGTE